MTLSLYILHIQVYNINAYSTICKCICFFRLREGYIHRLQKDVNNLNETIEFERKMAREKDKKQVLYNMLCNIYIVIAFVNMLKLRTACTLQISIRIESYICYDG